MQFSLSTNIHICFLQFWLSVSLPLMYSNLLCFEAEKKCHFINILWLCLFRVIFSLSSQAQFLRFWTQFLRSSWHISFTSLLHILYWSLSTFIFLLFGCHWLFLRKPDYYSVQTTISLGKSTMVYSCFAIPKAYSWLRSRCFIKKSILMLNKI